MSKDKKYDDFDQATFIVVDDSSHENSERIKISRKLINDDSISIEARVLIMRVMVWENDFPNKRVTSKSLVKMFSQTEGRNKIYRLINEAIGAGYLNRVKGVVMTTGKVNEI